VSDDPEDQPAVPTALVVGAGAVGSRAARQLVSTGFRVLVVEPRAERAEAVVRALGDGAVACSAEAARDEVDAQVAVLAFGPEVHAPMALALVDRGIPVVSVADDPADVGALLELDQVARARGVAVAVGAGFSPGFSCLLAVHAAGLFEEVSEIHVARAGTGGPACAQRHHRALRGEAVTWRDGAWVRRSAGSGRELCWFPDPIGGRDCYRAALADPVLLVRAVEGVERVTARLSATRRDRLTSRLPMLRPPHEDGGPGGVRVEVRGRMADGGTQTVVYGAMEVPSMAAGAVAAVAAAQLAGGRVRRSGAGGLAELLDPLPALVALAERGVKAAAFTG
jgi:hypothetical protein